MREVGIVHKVRGTFATVRFDRKTACENCNMCLKPREANYVELRVKNTLSAKAGDSVEVAMGDRAVLTAALLVYAVPLIIMGIVLSVTYTLDIGICLAATFGSLILAFISVALIDKFVIRQKKEYAPTMIAIVNADKEDKEQNAAAETSGKTEATATAETEAEAESTSVHTEE